MSAFPFVEGPLDLPNLRDWIAREWAEDRQLSKLDGRWVRSVVAKAALWWVTEEACELLTVSAPTWPAEHALTREDPVMPTGLAVFAQDFEGTDASPEYPDTRVLVSAIMWGPAILPPVPGYPTGRRGMSVAMFRRLDLGVGLTPHELEVAGPQIAAHGVEGNVTGHMFVYLGRTDWVFGTGAEVMVPDNPYGESASTAASMAEDRRLLGSLWALTRTPVMVTRVQHLPRASSRRVVRAGGSPEVRVLTLGGTRTSAPTDAPGVAGTGRAWSHRWIVRPHWVRQRYGPGLASTRTILRGPFEKGPADKPLIGGERVFKIVGPRPVTSNDGTERR